MIGTKRRNVSLRSDAEESAFQGKRALGESPFQSQTLDSSPQHVGSTPTLDLQRAAASRQHVRALNTQFASWVQSQSQNHPDELWEDGIRDYLTHASNILEKFSDVVSWLKANSVNGGVLPLLKSSTAEKQPDKEGNKNDGKALTDKPTFGAPSKFVSSWSSTVSSNTQTPAQSTPSFFPWTSGITNQSPSSGATASLDSSSNGQVPAVGTAPLFSPWTSGTFSKNLSPSSGTNASGGSSSSSQVGAQASPPITSPFASGAFAKIQSQPCGTTASVADGVSWSFGPKKLSPSSGIYASGGSPSSSEVGAQGAPHVTTPLSSGIFTKNQSQPSATNASSPSGTSWSFGTSSNNESPFKLGSQSTGPTNQGAVNDDADEENEEQPSSPSVKKAEEKGVTVAHEVKCKLYLKASDPADKDPWKDKGTGQLSIRCKEGASKGSKEAKPMIVIRNDAGRILLNAFLYPGIKTNSVKSNSLMAIFHTAGESGGDGNSGDVVARTFLIKTKNQEERNKLAEVIRDHAPSA